LLHLNCTRVVRALRALPASPLSALPALLAAVAVLSCAGAPAGGPAGAGAGDGVLPGGQAEGVLMIPPLRLPAVVRPTAEAVGERGLEVRLREGAPSPDRAGPVAVPQVPAAALPADVAARLLSRLPALPSTEAEPFRFPPASPPPPRAGRTVVTTFPPPDTTAPTPPAAAAVPLAVQRIVPTGETELAPHVTITFSEAMVPLTTVAGTAALQPPARLTPQPPGEWQWLDTRNLRFVPEGRFPMATQFSVEVPAGVRSAGGRQLEAPVSAMFATPAPRAIGAWPALHLDGDDPAGRPSPGRGGGQYGGAAATSVSLQPVILIVFDQRIDPAAVLRATRIAAGGRAHAIRLASAAEVAADTLVRLLAAEADTGRWIAVRPSQPLPQAADVRVVVGGGAGSAEGPRTTTVAQELRFRTYGPLRIASRHCGFADECGPGQPWQIYFTNPVDEATWSDTFVRVEPALDVVVRVSGTQLSIAGNSRPNTRYRVTVGGSVRDHFGQALDAPRHVTFNVGPAHPVIALPGAPLVVLDPDGPPRVRVQSQGHASLWVRVYRVRPDQWQEWGRALRRSQEQSGSRLEAPGVLVTDTVIRVAGGGEQFAETLVDVAPALAAGLGHAIVVVEPAPDARVAAGQRRRLPGAAWVQATRIGLSAAADAEELLVWATSLQSGMPLPGAVLRMPPSGVSAVAAADGTARLRLDSVAGYEVIAAYGSDTALLPYHEYGIGRVGWQGSGAGGELRWFVFADRGLYLPGETVHLKGWLRHVRSRAGLELALPADVASVAFRVRGARGGELGTGSMDIGRLGGFSTALELPAAMNLGQLWFQLTAQGRALPRHGAETQHMVNVQEFRRPDYEVVAEADAGPHRVGDVVDVKLRASYYGGGALGGADVQWRVSTRPGRYSPPGWDRWHFGRASWWGSQMAGMRPRPPAELAGSTDGAGSHSLLIDLLAVDPPFVTAVRAQADVRDVTRQAGSADVNLLVHPAALNVGLRSSRHWLGRGEPGEIEVVVVDHGGRAVAGREVDIVLERVTTGPWGGRMPPEVAVSDARTVCRVVSRETPVACTVTEDSAGTYRLRGDIRDDAGRVSRTELVLSVSGAASQPRPWEGPGRIELLADRDEYQPGDTARILVQTPFHPAEALLTVRNGGVLATERLRIDSAEHELRLPITAEHISSIAVRIDLVDAGRGTRFARAEATLAVPPHRRALDVLVLPRDSVLQPGVETVVDVEVRDADGRPAPGAEVALWMVDEAVLGLGGYRLRSPLDAFYAPRQSYTRDQQNRRWVAHWPRSAGPGTLSGVVLGGTGAALAGVTVSLDGTRITTTTAFDGSFTLRGVADGEYVLRLQAPDGNTGSTRVVVPAGGAHVGNVVLGALGITDVAIALRESGQELAAVVAAAPPPPPIPGDMRLEGITIAATTFADDTEDVRTDLSPLAFFEPSLLADSAGRVRVTVRMPGSLTRYRVMAVAVAGAARFGTGEAAVTARREMTVRVTAPRFLNHGDRFEMPVLVQNVSSRTLVIDVAARASGVRLADDAAGRRLTLAPGARTEVRFAAEAVQPGSAHVQVIASAVPAQDTGVQSRASAPLTDATAVTIPVYSPATAEAFAVYGTIDSDVPTVLPLARPAGVIAGFGGLEIGVTSTALHALTDAVLYLHSYPFDGAEHVASRVMAVAALRDVLAAFAADGLPPVEQLVAATQRDIALLAGMQHGDGGWPFWRGGTTSNPFVSVHVAHALQRAQAKDFAVPGPVLDRAAGYLRGFDGAVASWPLPARQSAGAYALYVRQRLGDAGVISEARRMATARPTQVGGELPVEAIAWLLHVLAAEPGAQGEADELRRRVMNRAVETAAGVTFAERYTDGAHLLLHSRQRTDAVVLEALMTADAGSDLVPKLAQSLLAYRTSGRWAGTQENAWALLALDRYFRRYEATTPAFQSRVWLGETFAGSHSFQGRTTERQHVSVPMPELLRFDAPQLVIARAGAGRLYYRAALRYAPADTRLPAAERGFTVTRGYEAVDDAADVRRADDGTWYVRAGARVRVRLQMTAPAVRFHVALTDPLPAGFEPLNPELRGTGSTEDPGAALTADRGAGRFPPWQPRWFSHQNLRDDRAEAFATVLSAGTYDYTYLARATTPGTFIVPPARAEMMYEPETFGRGSGERVVVEERRQSGQ
jgi:alpha-2-macroglobulin